MKAGLLDQRIEIQSQTLTKDSYGQDIPTWTTFATVWADVIPLEGRQLPAEERYVALRKTENVLYRVKLRNLPNLTIDMRVLYEAKYYDIKSIQRLGRKEGHQLFIALQRDMQ